MVEPKGLGTGSVFIWILLLSRQEISPPTPHQSSYCVLQKQKTRIETGFIVPNLSSDFTLLRSVDFFFVGHSISRLSHP